MAQGDWYTFYWILFIITGATVEIVALRDKDPGDTLSEHVWRVLKVERRGREKAEVAEVLPVRIFRIVLRLIVFVFFVWLALHFSMGWLST